MILIVNDCTTVRIGKAIVEVFWNDVRIAARTIVYADALTVGAMKAFALDAEAKYRAQLSQQFSTKAA